MVQDEESECREEQPVAPALFCGNLDLLEVSVPTSTITNDSNEQDSEDEEAREDFKLLLKESEEGFHEYMAPMEHDQNIARGIKQCIDEDRTRVGDDEGSSRLAHYMKMNAKLQEDTSQTVVEDRKSKNKQRRASKSGLHDFTNKKRKTEKKKRMQSMDGM